MTKTPFLGIPFDDGSMTEAVETAMRLIERRGAAAVTPNPEIMLAARRDPALHRAIEQADLILPDGIGLLLASRIAGQPLRHRLPGIDFASALLKRLDAVRGSVYLLGGRPDVAEKAARRLAQAFPNLVVSGARHGYFDCREEQSLLDELRQKAPDLLLVCLGSPRQELWIARHAHELPVGLMIGLGGALDVFAGCKRRAPKHWRRLGLEWLFRLIGEPWRLLRMIRLPAILWAALTERDRGVRWKKAN